MSDLISIPVRPDHISKDEIPGYEKISFVLAGAMPPIGSEENDLPLKNDDHEKDL